MKSRLLTLSLRTKLVVSIAGLILVLGLVGTFYARVTLANASNGEFDRRGLAIAHELESHATELLLTNDLFGLHRRVTNLATTNLDVRYVAVLDAGGNVRASTFPQALPIGLREANAVPAGHRYSLVTLETNEGEVRDVAYPINGGQQGIIRLGLTRTSVQGHVNSMTRNLLALTGVALVTGVGVAYVLGTVLSRPLERLAEGAIAVGRGEPANQADLYLHPELGKVAVAFDQMTQQLREKDEERSQLLARVLGAQEDERKRIARELHDEAAQALASMLLGLNRIEAASSQSAIREEAADLKTTTSHALALMRDMARELRPSILDDLGLVAALGRYTADFGPKHGIVTEFHASSCEGMRLRPEVETALYRISQEALTNVVRHARASSANVLLERRAGAVMLVVEDDGIGFDSKRLRPNASARLGIMGMEERALLVNGTFNIESDPGRGTAIFVQVPDA